MPRAPLFGKREAADGPLNNFGPKCNGAKIKNGFRKIKIDFRENGRSKKNSDGRQARFAKDEWLTLKGAFEQRRTSWSKAENKAARFERGNTERFKDQSAIWKSKKRIAPMANPTSNPPLQTKGGKAKGQKSKEGKGGAQAVKFTCLELSECDPVIEEIPENGVNVATRQINLANAHGVGDWERKSRAKDCDSIIDTGFNGG